MILDLDASRDRSSRLHDSRIFPVMKFSCSTVYASSYDVPYILFFHLFVVNMWSLSDDFPLIMAWIPDPSPNISSWCGPIFHEESIQILFIVYQTGQIYILLPVPYP